MKPWKRWRLPASERRLEISTGGKWFLLSTLLLGVAAVYSGNNVIYLIESLLLSSLLFSGVLSELTVSRVRVKRTLAQGVAGEPTRDTLFVENRSWLPLYCVEVGEWTGRGFQPLDFLLRLPARSEARLASRQVLPERGRHEWSGLAVATSFPFGFARKLRILPGAGSRILWPAAMPGEARAGKRGEWEWEAGELEPLEPGQDVSRVHWPSSFRQGQLLARPWRPLREESEVELDFETGGKLEEKIRRASGCLQRGGSALVLKGKGGLRRVDGRGHALDTLALLPKEDT